MNGMDLWDGVILAVAGYVAVLSLVRLMSTHRKKVSEELQQQIRAEQERKRLAERLEAKRQREEKRSTNRESAA
jgi:hypothetical protein